MKSKKTFLIAVLAVFVIISVSALSGCGFYNVQKGGTGHFITKKQYESLKLGTHPSTILAMLGKPTFRREHGRILYYCSKNTKKRCVEFRFHHIFLRGKVKHHFVRGLILQSKKIIR